MFVECWKFIFPQCLHSAWFRNRRDFLEFQMEEVRNKDGAKRWFKSNNCCAPARKVRETSPAQHVFPRAMQLWIFSSAEFIYSNNYLGPSVSMACCESPPNETISAARRRKFRPLRMKIYVWEKLNRHVIRVDSSQLRTWNNKRMGLLLMAVGVKYSFLISNCILFHPL